MHDGDSMTGYTPPTALPRWLLNRADMRDAITRHDFGQVFLLARSEAGTSYSSIAAECGIKPERVGQLARGIGSVTTFEKIGQIADSLRIPGHLVGLAPRDWETPARTATPDEGEDDVRRRDLVKASAGIGLAAALPDLSRAALGRRIGSDTPDRLGERTARLRRLDDVLGGGDTYRVYLGEYQATKVALRDSVYSEATGRALLSVLAEQAQQAGWAAFDGGRHRDATGLYEESYAAATEAGDAALAGNALAFLAYQAVAGDRQAGIEIAARSCATAGPGAAPGVRALLYERLEWAYAVAGVTAEAERALEVAGVALTQVDSPQPDWVAWVDATELGIMTGRCWTELGRPLRAVPALTSALARYDDAHARDKSLYLSWLAEAYATAGEIEQAAVVASRALDLAAGVASVRPRQRLAPVLARLGAHEALPAVADVMEKARAR
ncbi:XRE family transcriptional regulator [Streptomyces sp. NPDC091292]|uniref:XRE family transcriptional regulator n=1 Tax=Streptomyces sp. NPDC091292 TaxID=3365991 RepID=UPI0038001C84